VLEDDLKRFFDGHQIGGLLPAPELDAFDVRGRNRGAGHDPASLLRINPFKKGTVPFSIA
jgi:hypothetical protein